MTIFCPKCGALSSGEHKFCRLCGFALETVARMVESDRTEDTAPSIQSKSLDYTKVRRLAAAGFLSVLLAAVIGSLLRLFERHGANIPTLEFAALSVLAVVLGFGGLLLFGYSFFALIPKNLGTGAGGGVKKSATAETARLQGAPEALPLPSVTENTTDILPSKVAVNLEEEGQRPNAIET